ncbi:MAG TPA: oligopeptide transporter, OPT family, partial [Thermoanaerobaculia bacterium]|nr:oligopeptide transporter, OPT family [Thermoanaerobaculia bacterium]
SGVLLGILFGAANAYIGLRVGLTITASIPAAVMTVVAFRALRLRSTILEANLSQTIGSASSSLASGTIFTIPALFLWGVAPPYYQVVALAFLGAVLGLTAMIPLRRLLIVQAHQELPYPEGTACAEVLRATEGGAQHGVWIFRGMGVGALVKLAVGAFFLIPSAFAFEVPGLPKAEVALELAPALLAVGFILGYRQSGVLVAGSIVSALALTPLIAWLGARMTVPLFPETVKTIGEMNAGEIWSRYVRYIGAGAVATAGILTVLKSLPTMVGAFAAVARGIRGVRGGPSGVAAGAVPATDRDLPPAVIVGGIATVIAATALIPPIFGGGLSAGQRLICAAGAGIFGLLFVAVAARIVGIIGVSSQPTSGITLVTLLGVASVFAANGWTDVGARAAVLTVGTVVAIAASKAGDISQDLKTGYLVGATPAKQQLGQLIGAAFACWVVAGVVLLLGNTYEFGTPQLAAPQAVLMKTIIEGVLAGNLPWNLVGTGAGIAISAMLCGVSGLAFAIGVYLPLATMLAIYVGGCVRAAVERGRPARQGNTAKGVGSDPGILAASGFVAGEGLAGILIAVLAWQNVIPKSKAALLGGVPGNVAMLLTVAGLCAFLYAAGRARAQS